MLAPTRPAQLTAARVRLSHRHQPPTGAKGATVNEFVVPAVVTPDPDANTTDLLVDRVAQAPADALFALPTADGGWEDVTAEEFHR